MSDTVLGNTTSTTTYNPFGEMDSESYTVAGAPLYEVSYVRDKLGRIDIRTEMIEGQTTKYDYDYDLAGRLTDVYVNDEPDPISHYDYDDNGNRLAATRRSLGEGGQTNGDTPIVYNRMYDAQDRMTAYCSSEPACTTYDYISRRRRVIRNRSGNHDPGLLERPVTGPRSLSSLSSARIFPIFQGVLGPMTESLS